MIKPPDTHGRPQSEVTQEVIVHFYRHGKLTRRELLDFVGEGQKTDNVLRYLKGHGFIRNVRRGVWELA
ncbi:MAG: hypothetical protein DWP95_10315 [Proteobacteria bacterium]|nr:MAG: hypothetical protein DWP95_10315 [Pseudomonadota bacterium]